MNNNETVWIGTEEEFEELTDYNEETLYIIVEEEDE